MDELRRIHPQAIPAALARAKQYRLLNEPHEAESICRDILGIEPEHQEAVRTLLLALTDQLIRNYRLMRDEARALLPRLESEYDREYLAGVIAERCGKTLMAQGNPPSVILEAIREAMEHFDRAIPMQDETNDEAILRWNACVRLIRRHGLEPDSEAGEEIQFESFDDEVPFR